MRSQLTVEGLFPDLPLASVVPGICEYEIIFLLQVLMVSAYVPYKGRKRQLCPYCSLLQDFTQTFLFW